MGNTNSIAERKTLNYENLASYRGAMTPNEVSINLSKFINTVYNSECKKSGPIITANYGVIEDGTNQLIDMEIMIPVSNGELLPKPYKFVSNLTKNNLVYTQFHGDPANIQSIFVELMHCIQREGLKHKAIYNVHLNDGAFTGLEQPLIDIYIETI